MASHHFIGSGTVSPALEKAARNPEVLGDLIAAKVGSAELEVVDRSLVAFDNGGLTLVWVLAESHLVLHHWSEEGFATIDLHICDYRGSNASKAAALVEALEAFCFEPVTARWHEIHLEDPVSVAATAPA